MLSVFIRSDQIYTAPLKYILSVFSKCKQCPLVFSNDWRDADLIFDHLDVNTVSITIEIYEALLNKHVFGHENFLKNSTCVLNAQNKPDWLATAFYMINGFQEYQSADDSDYFDQYGRFRFDKSYQYKYQCIEDNLVLDCFNAFCKEHTVLAKYAKNERPVRVFLSHDIDTIHGAFLQDGLWALKRGRFDVVMKLIMNEVLLRPDWKNMDKIVRLHDAQDLKSTFFWLATKKVGANGVKNADYTVTKLKHLTESTHSNGLHKSCYDTTISEELNMLPFRTTLNRYHFLKFNIPTAWDALEESQVRFDASLGFAEQIGFRNSYGMPFRPYDIKTKVPYSFIEVPLNVMDGTMHRYMKLPKENTATRVIEFIEKNKTNTIISILWHNTYFTKYKYAGYLEEYKKVLLYLYETGVTSITPDEIIKEYGD